MKIAHRKAQAGASGAFQANYFQWALTTNMLRRVPLRLSGVLGEIALDIPEEAQSIDAVNKLSPPTSLALDVEVVRFRPQETPRELPRRKENAFLLRKLSLVNARFCVHGSLLSRERSKLKGNFRPLSENFEQKLIYISYRSQNVNTFVHISKPLQPKAGLVDCS